MKESHLEAAITICYFRLGEAILLFTLWGSGVSQNTGPACTPERMVVQLTGPWKGSSISGNIHPCFIICNSSVIRKGMFRKVQMQ